MDVFDFKQDNSPHKIEKKDLDNKGINESSELAKDINYSDIRLENELDKELENYLENYLLQLQRKKNLFCTSFSFQLSFSASSTLMIILVFVFFDFHSVSRRLWVIRGVCGAVLLMVIWLSQDPQTTA
jgi:hypothetical protein